MQLIIFIIVVCLFIGLSSGKGAKRGSIKLKPETITPILPTISTDFDLAPFQEVPDALPQTEDSWWTISKDKSTLTSYGEKLDTIRIRSENSAKASANKYESDYAKLDNQRLQIYRRLYHSKKFTSRFKELKTLKINPNDLPLILETNLPIRPQGYSAAELTKKYSYQVNVGGAIGKTLSTNGGLRNPNNLYAAAVMGLIAGGIMLIKGKSVNSKLKRLLEEGRGDIIKYNISNKTLVEGLRKQHEEIVSFSNRLKQSEIRLIELINRVNQIPQNLKKLNQISIENRKDLEYLHHYTIQAIAYSKAKI